MEIGAKTHIGLVRKANEDNYLIDRENGIFAVADGMGGLHRGDVASSLAIETLVQWIKERGTRVSPTLEELQQVMEAINQIVYTKQIQLGQGQMGTTLSVAAIHQDQVSIGHAGDSRIYLANKDEVHLLSEDHSYVAELLRRGEIEKEDAINNQQRNVLIKAIGPESSLEPQVVSNKINIGDYLVLCTDGLYKDLDMEVELLGLVQQQISVQDMVEQLTELALQKGGQDNITVVIIHYE